MKTSILAAAVMVVAAQAPGLARDDERSCARASVPLACPSLADAQISFYNARYAVAAAQTLELPAADQDDPAIY